MKYSLPPPKTHKRSCFVMALGSLYCAATLSALAEPVSWVGTAGDQRWSTAANWSPAKIPAAGDAVTIASSSETILLDVATAELSDFELTGGTVSMTGWDTSLSAESVTIGAGGKLTCEGPFTAEKDGSGAYVNATRVWVRCEDLQIAPGGTIDVTGKGFAGLDPSTKADWIRRGCGPAAGNGQQFGGGHGGMNKVDVKSGAYGSVSTPETPGSGGGAVQTTAGGAGGGVIRIEATGTLTVYGPVVANGTRTTDVTSSGAGGSIYLTCNRFVGENASLSATGGVGVFSRDGKPLNGAGGRIALVTATDAQNVCSGMVFDASYGGLPQDFHAKNNVDLGTLYFSDSSLFLAQNGAGFAGQLYIPGFASWTIPGSVTFDRPLRIAHEGFQLSVGGDLTISGPATQFEMGGATFYGDLVDVPVGCDSESAWALRVGGAVRLQNQAKMTFYPAPRALMNEGIDPDFTMPGLTADTVTIGNGSIMTCAGPCNDATNSVGTFVEAGRVWIDCRDLSIDEGGAIDVTSKGFAGTDKRENPSWTNKGMGPGFGRAESFGGSHGGVSKPDADGVIYGSIEAPVTPGSGGGGAMHGNGGAGGGIVRIQASGTITVNGSIRANGGVGRDANSSGAGGSIFLTCARFVGAQGLVQAAGGSGHSFRQNNNPMNGGGGRISVVTTSPSQNAVSGMRFDVSYGPLSSGDFVTNNRAECGTLYFSDASLFLAQEGLGFAGQLYIPGFDAWTTDGDYVLTDPLRFTADGFRLSVGGDLIVSGPMAKLEMVGNNVMPAKKIDHTNQHLSITADRLLRVHGGQTPWALDVAGDFQLIDNAKASFFPAVTAMTDESTAYGGNIAVQGALSLAAGSVLATRCDPTNGASVAISADSVTIAEDALITAVDFGYAHQVGPGKGWGRTIGGGYGGTGGNFNTNANGTVRDGATYGDPLRPWQPGSGGGYAWNNVGTRGGGGAIRIRAARTFRLDGALDASAPNLGTYATTGGGSGGSIFVECKSFLGTGSLRADGGSILKAYNYSNGTPYVAAGGGGRIAVYTGMLYDPETMSPSCMTLLETAPETFTGTATAAGGRYTMNINGTETFFPDYDGGDGTVCFIRVSLPYTLLLFR